jgi:DNA repair exonuclease SbcCD ATPase subunit
VAVDKQRELAETPEDHAGRIDQLHEAVKGMMGTSAAAFQKIDDRDADLRDRLQKLEAQLVSSAGRLAAATTAIDSNDGNLKDKLRIMEQQLLATAEAAQAAANAPHAAAPVVGAAEIEALRAQIEAVNTYVQNMPAADAAEMAALGARMETTEQYISKVNHLTRSTAAGHQANGQQMFSTMGSGIAELMRRLHRQEDQHQLRHRPMDDSRSSTPTRRTR